MATFSTDFSGYSTGDIVTVGGGAWATQGTLTSWTRQVETDAGAIGGKRLNVQDDSQDWGSQFSLVVNDTIGAVAGDFEVLAAFRVTNVANREGDRPFGGPVLAQADNSSYGIVWPTASSVQLVEFTTGGALNQNLGSAFAVTAITNNALHWCRKGITDSAGTRTVRVKVWKDGEAEPGSWGSSVADSTLTNLKGGMGFFTYNAGPYITEWFSIGTGADSAPSPSPALSVLPGFFQRTNTLIRL